MVGLKTQFENNKMGNDVSLMSEQEAQQVERGTKALERVLNNFTGQFEIMPTRVLGPASDEESGNGTIELVVYARPSAMDAIKSALGNAPKVHGMVVLVREKGD